MKSSYLRPLCYVFGIMYFRIWSCVSPTTLVAVFSLLVGACVFSSSEPGATSDSSLPTNVQQAVVPIGKPLLTTDELLKQVNLKRDYIPYGRHARKYRRRMTPLYITIHSTQNYSLGADAWQHSKALKNGKLRSQKLRGGNRIGYLVWHYTIDQSRVVQHLPDNEQGEHADFDGPGNNFSLGLEMTENRGNSRSATIERTAKLTAYLMKKHGIPVRNVVPHYHWPRKGVERPHKNCPHFLLDNGKPGVKWRAFQHKVQGYYDLLTKPVEPRDQPQPRPYYPHFERYSRSYPELSYPRNFSGVTHC